MGCCGSTANVPSYPAATNVSMTFVAEPTQLVAEEPPATLHRQHSQAPPKHEPTPEPTHERPMTSHPSKGIRRVMSSPLQFAEGPTSLLSQIQRTQSAQVPQWGNRSIPTHINPGKYDGCRGYEPSMTTFQGHPTAGARALTSTVRQTLSTKYVPRLWL